MITHFKVWNIWRKKYGFNAWYKITVLFGLAPSGTFLMEEIIYKKEQRDEKSNFFSIFMPILVSILVAFMFAFLIVSLIKFSLANATNVEDPKIESPVAVAEAVNADEPIAPITEPEDTVEYLDVPLSEDLQDHIFEVCEVNGVDPLLVVAIIEKESMYNERVIGDRGRSYGLMQIQPKWHYSRMVELGCMDLLDPYQNISVGVNYISELLSRGKSLEWTLMAYNGGPSYANRKAAAGEVSSYVYRVLSIKEGLE